MQCNNTLTHKGPLKLWIVPTNLNKDTVNCFPMIFLQLWSTAYCIQGTSRAYIQSTTLGYPGLSKTTRLPIPQSIPLECYGMYSVLHTVCMSHVVDVTAQVCSRAKSGCTVSCSWYGWHHDHDGAMVLTSVPLVMRVQYIWFSRVILRSINTVVLVEDEETSCRYRLHLAP